MTQIHKHTRTVHQTRAEALHVSRRPKGFRSDIQALRALAVGLVVLNHLWPNRLTGGYVGVDVFFVISGFLITSHLAKEIFATSRLSLATFYARRIKRLLPAAFLVLAASSLAVFLWVPYSEWARTAREVTMSALYAENWSLAAQSVDYSALNDSATVAQHYWSLSVEEQFYFLWPVALYGLYRMGRRIGSPRRTMALGVTIVALASLVFSIYFTAGNPNPAYFVTPVRVWEFAAGGFLALAASRIRLPAAAAGLTASAGWVAIAAAAVTFSQDTQFPGWTAMLPVAGTVAVIAAGTGKARLPLHPLVSWKPVRLMGDISYSIYLWHWPMIVVAPYLLATTLNSWHKLGLMALCLPLAWLTKVMVEDHGKGWRILGRRPATTFMAMAAGIAVLALLSGGLAVGAKAREAAAQAVQDRQMNQPCHGPSALPDMGACPDALGPALVTVMGDANKYYLADPKCASDPTRKPAGVKSVDVCDFSDHDPNAISVWFAGDSHAEQWKPAVLEMAKKNRWKLTMSFIGGCPIADVHFAGYRKKESRNIVEACMSGAEAISDMIVHDRPEKVFYSIFSRKEILDDGTGRTQAAQYDAGLPKFWSRWAAAGSTVYVMADPPLNGFVRDAKCVALNPSDPIKCAVPRAVAQPADPLVAAVKSMGSKAIRLIDLTDHFCNADDCFAVVGNVAVYYDPDHLNREFTLLTVPFIQAKL